MKIAILGGYGDVGAVATRRLLALGCGSLRVGGRNPAAAQQSMDSLTYAERASSAVPGGALEYSHVDFRDAASLERFTEGCGVLLNCAGPSHEIGDRAARAAWRVGADYVDVAGDEPLCLALEDASWRAAGRVALLSAGLRPGLTALFPRYLAAHVVGADGWDRIEALTQSLGVFDRFTRVAAEDYLQAAAEQRSQPLAAWRNGPRSRALKRRDRVQLRGFPRRVSLLPQLDSEASRVAAALGILSGDWYNAISGEYVMAAFERVHTWSRAAAVEALCRASCLDLSGRDPYVVLSVELQGIRAGARQRRRQVLRGAGNSELTGAFAALSTWAVVRREVTPGRHYAGEVLEPIQTWARLRATSVTAELSIFDSDSDMGSEYDALQLSSKANDGLLDEGVL